MLQVNGRVALISMFMRERGRNGDRKRGGRGKADGWASKDKDGRYTVVAFKESVVPVGWLMLSTKTPTD